MPRPWEIGRHRGKLVLVYRDEHGERHRRSLGTADPREAERLAPALYDALTRPATTTIAGLWQAYTRAMEGRAVVGTMRHTWKALANRFGPLPAEAVTVAHCEAHTRARREAGIKDGTIHTELGHLRMVLLWAVKRGHIDKAPHIERPAKPRPGEKHLSRAQVRRLLDGCEMPHLRVFVILALSTAGRASAVLGLTWDRVDFERGKIDLRDPTIRTPHKGRAITPMTRQARAVLRDAQAGALSPFVVEYAGGRVASVKKGLAAAAKRAGLAKVTPHMLRHTAAVHMAEARVPMEEIASYLGHSNVAVTRGIYARFSPDHLAGAAEVLNYDDLDAGTSVPGRLSGRKI
jgi:site-specific recombinase XerC